MGSGLAPPCRSGRRRCNRGVAASRRRQTVRVGVHVGHGPAGHLPVRLEVGPPAEDADDAVEIPLGGRAVHSQEDSGSAPVTARLRHFRYWPSSAESSNSTVEKINNHYLKVTKIGLTRQITGFPVGNINCLRVTKIGWKREIIIDQK